MTWKLVGHAAEPVVQAALAAHEAIDDWDADIVLAGSEIAEDRPILDFGFGNKSAGCQ